MNKTPVLLLLFNRPKYTLRLIQALRKYSPKCIYIHCDGPREKNDLDKINCIKVKQIIKKYINWKCEKKIIYHEKNIGLRNSIITGINFLFLSEQKGIILEDSMLPSNSFFKFCDILLKKYEKNSNISLISGWNPIADYHYSASYFFSEHPKIWGWATWKRSWLLFDRKMISWPKNKKNKWMEKKLKKPFFFRFYWEKIFHDTYLKKTNTWDYNLVYSNWLNNKISIIPKYNLVNNQDLDEKNITTHKNNFNIKLKTKKLKFPLIHPLELKANSEFDNIFYKRFYNFKLFFFNIFFARIFKVFIKKIF